LAGHYERAEKSGSTKHFGLKSAVEGPTGFPEAIAAVLKIQGQRTYLFLKERKKIEPRTTQTIGSKGRTELDLRYRSVVPSVRYTFGTYVRGVREVRGCFCIFYQALDYLSV
jgi:hypothetical protein